jgi:prepilin peptidase CpaA
MIWIHLAVILWLAVCAAQDLLRRQVSNWLTIPPFAAAGVWAVWRGGETLLLYGLVTLVMLVLFWKGGTGGADGKILAVLAVVSPAALILALAANTLIGVVVWAWGTLSRRSRLCRRRASIHSNSILFRRFVRCSRSFCSTVTATTWANTP